MAQERQQIAESDTDGRTARLYLPAKRQLYLSDISAKASAGPAEDPFETFRTRYRAGAVQDAGTGTFDGRPVRKLRVKAGTRTITYYVRAANGIPVAIQVFQVPRQATRRPDGTLTPSRQGTGSVSRLTRVLRYDKLTASAKSQQLLRAPIPADAKPSPSRRRGA